MRYAGVLPDRRLARRAERLVRALVARRTVSVAGVARDWAEQMGYYRLLSNERVSIEHLAEGLYPWMRAPGGPPGGPPSGPRAPGHLLLLQDTTEVDFGAHAGRLRPGRALGWLSHNRRHGYCLHPALVVDAHSGHALGLADVRLWARPTARPDRHRKGYRDLPIEQKESVRWIAALEQAARRLRAGAYAAARLTTVADREADLYALFARLPVGCDAVVRACRDRRIAEGSGKLYAFLHRQPGAGEERIRLAGDLSRGRPGREAHLAYRFAPVTLMRPERSAKPDGAGRRDPPRLALWAVEVAELDPPAGTAPLLWRLLTTHPVGTLEEARTVAALYRQRWHLEQLFRLLKADGLDLEASELESGEALQRLAMLALGAALDVLRLLLAERGGEAAPQPLEQVFDAGERAGLAGLNAQLEGRAAKQQNPHAPNTLAWAAWILARLGGWSGYRSQHRAGPATYHRGLQRFHAITQGWQLALDDLYKP